MSFKADPASIKVCSIVLAFCLIALAGLSGRDAATAQSIALVINEYLADPPDGLAGDANGDGSRDSTQERVAIPRPCFLNACNHNRKTLPGPCSPVPL